LSDAPAGWTVAPLGELCLRIVDGSHNPPPATEDGVYMLSARNITSRKINFQEYRFISESDFALENERTNVRPGDVLLTTVGAIGRIAVVPDEIKPFALQRSVAVLKPNGAAIPQYLAYAIEAPAIQQFLRDNAKGTAQKGIYLKALGRLQLPLAPLAEQQRLANKLDSLLGSIDMCRERLDQVPQILKKFREAVLEAAVSGRLTEEWRGNPELTGWVTKRAAEVCTIVQSGGTPKAGFTESFGVPFLKVYNIVEQRVAFDYRPQYVPRATHEKELRKSRTLPGDVLMNIVGPPLGKVAVVPDTHSEWNINQAITLFRPGSDVSTQWIYTVLRSGRNVAEVIHQTRGSVGQVNISLSQCRDFDIPVPPHPEQAEIIRRLGELLALADNLQRRYQDGVSRVEKLTPSVLAKAFRGELVPQNPNDEPAAEMLERIRGIDQSHEIAILRSDPGISA
jgi:type I restriction enzyme S subunit